MKERNKRLRQAAMMPLLRRYSVWHTVAACAFCLAVLTAAAFILGFFLFVESSNRIEQPPSTVETDGIIVLTGGRARVETGLDLLRMRRGERLLISGVSPIVGDRVNFAQILGIDRNLLECCVDLGWEALNTNGNAAESAAWVEKHEFKRVLIVTNRYHMLRSLAELHHKMPQTELVPFPVEAEGNLWQSLLTGIMGMLGLPVEAGSNRWQPVVNIRLFASEYGKFLVVSARNFAEKCAQLW